MDRVVFLQTLPEKAERRAIGRLRGMKEMREERENGDKREDKNLRADR